MVIITDLPPEILDQIAAALDSPTDVRNLAAACTQLRLLLEPHHTQFRVIRAPLISPIWKEIAENRLLAQNIRVLEIQPSKRSHGDGINRLDKPVIPAIFQELEVPSLPASNNGDKVEKDTVRSYSAAKNTIMMDFDAERILVSALKGMSGLTSFKWTRTPPLINHNQEDDIWITLAKYCTSLNVIDVLDREKPSEWVVQVTDDRAYWRPRPPSLNPNFYLFKDLKSFSLHTETYNVRNLALPDVERCAEMLIGKCPNLEVLKLEYILYMNHNTKAVPASPLFSGPPWSSLRELTLHCFRFIATELASFLASHPTIEILTLESTRIDQLSLVLPPGALPRLKRLSTDMGWALSNAILNSIVSTPRPLEFIMGSSLDDVFLDSLEHSRGGPNLEKLVTHCGDDQDLNRLLARLSGIAPNLEWLDVNHHRSRRTFDRRLFTVFSQLPRLRTLQGIRFLNSNCESASENTEVIRALVTKCPNLQKISWYVGARLDHGLGVIIERTGSHVTWSIRAMVRGMEGCINFDPYWTRYCGSFQL